MRSFSSDIIEKSTKTNQTIAADSEPYASFRIARNRSVLDNIDLVEKVRVRRLDPNTITDGDIAVCHPKFKGENTKIWVCYLDEGKLRVRWVYDSENITEEKWTVVHAGAPDAIACAICFDSQVVENVRGYAEFVTGYENPFIFYVTPDGELKVIMLGGAIIEETLAAENVTDVSAVRGPSSKNGDWDLGLTVFFLMNGAIWYRQLINGVWYDAEQVSLSIPDETIVKIDAFNTWDYRVGVQCLTQSGKLYQIITYTEGIGVRGMEHIELKMSARLDFSGTNFYDEVVNDHIAVGMGANLTYLYGHSAVPLAVENVEDANDNWGTTIEVLFDYPNTIGTASASMFTLKDSNNIYYTCQSVALSQSGLKLTLTFADFNLAEDAANMTLIYTAPASGGLRSPAVQTASFSETFVPTGLYNPYFPPVFVKAWNNKKGEKVFVQFDEDITTGASSANAGSYGIQIQEYDYVPNGSLQTHVRSISSISAYAGDEVDFDDGTFDNVKKDNGNIVLDESTLAVHSNVVVYPQAGNLADLSAEQQANVFTTTDIVMGQANCYPFYQDGDVIRRDHVGHSTSSEHYIWLGGDVNATKISFDWKLPDTHSSNYCFLNVVLYRFTGTAGNISVANGTVAFASERGEQSDWAHVEYDIPSGFGAINYIVLAACDGDLYIKNFKANLPNASSGTATFTYSGYKVEGDDRLYWTATTPTGTAVTLEVKVGSGSYAQVSNGGLIPNLPASGTANLTIRATLSTANGAYTPSLSSIRICNALSTKIITLGLAIPNMTPAIGNAVVQYNGQGSLGGRGGPVAAFNGTFTPSGLTWKGNQNAEEHLAVALSGTLNYRAITYHDTKSDDHISVSLAATLTLTDIHDL